MPEPKTIFQNAVEITLRIGFLLLLIAWCFQILYPFLSIVLWGIILAVTVAPLYHTLRIRLGNRGKLTATLITVVALGIVFIPSYLFVDSLIVGLRVLGEQFRSGEFEIPPPPENVANWPIVGQSIHGAWELASTNVGDAFEKYQSQLAAFGSSMLNSMLGTGLGILQFLFSIIVAGYFGYLRTRSQDDSEFLWKAGWRSRR